MEKLQGKYRESLKYIKRKHLRNVRIENTEHWEFLIQIRFIQTSNV